MTEGVTAPYQSITVSETLAELVRVKKCALGYFMGFALATFYYVAVSPFVPYGPLIIPAGPFSVYAGDLPSFVLLVLVVTVLFYGWKNNNRWTTLEKRLLDTETIKPLSSATTGPRQSGFHWVGPPPDVYLSRILRRLQILTYAGLSGTLVAFSITSFSPGPSGGNGAVFNALYFGGVVAFFALIVGATFWSKTGLRGLGLSEKGILLVTPHEQYNIPWESVCGAGKVERALGGLIEGGPTESHWFIAWSAELPDTKQIVKSLRGAAKLKDGKVILWFGNHWEKVCAIVSRPECPRFEIPMETWHAMNRSPPEGWPTG